MSAETSTTQQPSEPKPVPRRRTANPLPEMDWALLATVLGLMSFGFVMVASASMTVAEVRYADPFHFVLRHAIAIGLGTLLGLIAFAIPLKAWERLGPLLFLLGIGLLVLVLVPGVGRSANGATRWIPLGPLNLQSSELMKLFAVIYIAGYLVRRREDVANKITGFVRPMLLLAIPAALILKQPDFGTTAVIMAAALGMLYLGGVRLTHFAILFGLLAAAAVALVIYEPYRMARATSFLDPWEDPFGASYQLIQALIALGRGEWLGVGLGNGIQKQFFLPEAHTDFLFANIGEELGLAGTMSVILAFVFVTWRALAIGVRAEKQDLCFASFVAHGFAILIALQAFVNVGVNTGLLPTKGLTLPFLSYGSNSIMVGCIMVAILLRIDMETRNAAKGRIPQGRLTWARA